MSLFAVAVWPVQKWLEERLPQLIALAITLLLTVFVLSALLALSVWGIGQVGRWMIVNAAHVQAFYVQLTQWLESHGIFVVGIFLERFDVAWLVRPAQGLASTVRTLIAFAMLVLVFLMLALLEVRDFKAKLQSACPSVSLIQFLIGSYLEPRLSGSALSISPFLVVFAVFFAALLWGISDNQEGVVTLLVDGRRCLQRLLLSSRSGHCSPCPHSFATKLAKCLTADQVTLNVEGVVDGGVC